MTDPLRELVVQSLDLMNRSFVDFSQPQSVAMEFYHQFRKLWDRGIPVGMGLGHLLLRPEPSVAVAIQRLGENGRPTERLVALQFEQPVVPVPGYAETVLVSTTPAEVPAGVTLIVFDVRRWAVAR